MRRSRPYIAKRHVERLAGERVAEARLVVRIGVEVLDRRRRLGALVGAAVEDRHVVAAIDELADDWDAGRSGAADDEDALGHGGDAGTPAARRDEVSL